MAQIARHDVAQSVIGYNVKLTGLIQSDYMESLST